MKTALLVAIAILGVVGIGSAYAGDGGGGSAPNTFFTELPGVIAHPPGQVPDYAGLPHGRTTQSYAKSVPVAAGPS